MSEYIVEILRKAADGDAFRGEIPCGETADLIENLQARFARLVQAVRNNFFIAEKTQGGGVDARVTNGKELQEALSDSGALEWQAKHDADIRAEANTEILNHPEISNFVKGVVIEAQHQRKRWGSEHDGGKSPEDWLWLIGYLVTKATQANRYGDQEKYIHHIITAAAACANWHANVTGSDSSMRPGVSSEDSRVKQDSRQSNPQSKGDNLEPRGGVE